MSTHSQSTAPERIILGQGSDTCNTAKPAPLDWSSFRDKLHNDKVYSDNLEDSIEVTNKGQVSSSDNYSISPREVTVSDKQRPYSRKNTWGRGRRRDNNNNNNNRTGGNDGGVNNVAKLSKGVTNAGNSNSPNSISSGGKRIKKNGKIDNNYQPVTKRRTHIGRQEVDDEKNVVLQERKTDVTCGSNNNGLTVVSPTKTNAWTCGENQRLFSTLTYGRGQNKDPLGSGQDETYEETSGQQKTGVPGGKNNNKPTYTTISDSKQNNRVGVEGYKYTTSFHSNNTNMQSNTNDTNSRRAAGYPFNRYWNPKDDTMGWEKGSNNNNRPKSQDGGMYRHYGPPVLAINTGGDYPPQHYEATSAGVQKQKQRYNQPSQQFWGRTSGYNHRTSQKMNSNHYHTRRHSPYFERYSDSNLSDASHTTPPLTPQSLSNNFRDISRETMMQSSPLSPESPLTMAIMGMPMEVNRMMLDQQLMMLPFWARQRTLVVLHGDNHHVDPSPITVSESSLSPSHQGYNNKKDGDYKRVPGDNSEVSLRENDVCLPSSPTPLDIVSSNHARGENTNIGNKGGDGDHMRTKISSQKSKSEHQGKKNTESLSIVLPEQSLLMNRNNVEHKELCSHSPSTIKEYGDTNKSESEKRTSVSPNREVNVNNSTSHKNFPNNSRTTRESQFRRYPLCSSLEEEQQRMAKTAFSYGLQQQAVSGQTLRPYAFSHQGLSEELYDFVANVELTKEERELREASHCRIEHCIELLVEKGLKAFHKRMKFDDKKRKGNSFKEGDLSNTKDSNEIEENDGTKTTFPKPYLVLFGSYALGLSTPCSDLDFTVVVPDGVVSQYGSEYYSPPLPPPSRYSSTSSTASPTAAQQQDKEPKFIFPVTELGFLRLIAEHLREEPFNMETKVIDMCKVPVVHCFDPKSRVACDINVNMKHMSKVVEIQKAWLTLEERIDRMEGTGCSTALGGLDVLWPPIPAPFISTAKALIMLTKIALRQWGLGTSFTGGLSSTAVYLLVERFLREKREYLKSFDVMTRFFSHWKTTSVRGTSEDCTGNVSATGTTAKQPPSYAPPKRPSLISKVLIEFWNYLSQDGFVHGYHVHDIFSVQPKGAYHGARQSNKKFGTNKEKLILTDIVSSPVAKSGGKSSPTPLSSVELQVVSQQTTHLEIPEKKALERESTSEETNQSKIDEISQLSPKNEIPNTTQANDNKVQMVEDIHKVSKEIGVESTVSDTTTNQSKPASFDDGTSIDKQHNISHYWSPTSLVEGFDSIESGKENQQPKQLLLNPVETDVVQQTSMTSVGFCGEDNNISSKDGILTEGVKEHTTSSNELKTIRNKTESVYRTDDGNVEEEDDDPYVYGPALAFITEADSATTPVPFSETTHSARATVNKKRVPEHLLPDVARRCNRLGEIQILFRHSASTLESLVGNPTPHMWALPMTPFSAVLADPRMLRSQQQQSMMNNIGAMSNNNRDVYNNYNSAPGSKPQKRHH